MLAWKCILADEKVLLLILACWMSEDHVTFASKDFTDCQIHTNVLCWICPTRAHLPGHRIPWRFNQFNGEFSVSLWGLPFATLASIPQWNDKLGYFLAYPTCFVLLLYHSHKFQVAPQISSPFELTVGAAPIHDFHANNNAFYRCALLWRECLDIFLFLSDKVHDQLLQSCSLVGEMSRVCKWYSDSSSHCSISSRR